MRHWRSISLLISMCVLLAACASPATPGLTGPTVLENAAGVPGAEAARNADNQPVCQVVGPFNDFEPYAPVDELDWQFGPADALVTIVEYSDFQCPYCARLEANLLALQAAYPEDVRLVYRHFPLKSHDKALLAAQAAEAAGAQERSQFFAMKNLLFENQAEWQEMSPKRFETWLESQAGSLGLDVDRFLQDLEDPQTKARLEAAQQADIPGLEGTPFLILNGGAFKGSWDLNNLKAIVEVYRQAAQSVGRERLADYPATQFKTPEDVERALAFYQEIEASMQGRIFDECPPQVIEPGRHYTATIVTAKGKVVVRLEPERAPFAVNNFVFLARQGWYDGLTFHRVLPGFIAQAGDPSGYGLGGPGYLFSDEISQGFDKPGVVAMANAGFNTNGAQFFITDKALPQLDGGYTIFGQVVEGMEVVRSLTARDPNQKGTLPEGDRIETIIIEEST